jgi:hypothetical protein
MSWIRGIQLDQAYQQLTTIRRCGPKIEAIRWGAGRERGMVEL